MNRQRKLAIFKNIMYQQITHQLKQQIIHSGIIELSMCFMAQFFKSILPCSCLRICKQSNRCAALMLIKHLDFIIPTTQLVFYLQ